jgi:hypothetical protein
MSDGKYTDIYGQPGYMKPQTDYLFIPKDLNTIRVQTDGVHIAAVELVGSDGKRPDCKVNCLKGNKMKFTEIRLNHGEVVVGIYGSTFKYNYGLFKELGLLIGKVE